MDDITTEPPDAGPLKETSMSSVAQVALSVNPAIVATSAPVCPALSDLKTFVCDWPLTVFALFAVVALGTVGKAERSSLAAVTARFLIFAVVIAFFLIFAVVT